MQSYAHVVTRLKQRGYEQLGAGSYSAVLAKPTGNTVIRVSTDRSFEPYAIWAHKTGYAGNFSPLVYELHRYDWGHVARMERLDMTLLHAVEGGLDVPSTLFGQYGIHNWYSKFPGLRRFHMAVQGAGFTGDWGDRNWMVVMSPYSTTPRRLVLTDPQGPDCYVLKGHHKRWHWHNVKQVTEPAHSIDQVIAEWLRAA